MSRGHGARDAQGPRAVTSRIAELVAQDHHPVAIALEIDGREPRPLLDALAATKRAGEQALGTAVWETTALLRETSIGEQRQRFAGEPRRASQR